MGLDSFWEIPKGCPAPKFDPPLRLCSGMLSASGEGSFRGKVYDSLVETVTGESLYQEEIPTETVAKMAKSLELMEFDDLPSNLRESAEYDYSVSKEEYEDLRRMFSIYANAGAVLKGWW